MGGCVKYIYFTVFASLQPYFMVFDDAIYNQNILHYRD